MVLKVLEKGAVGSLVGASMADYRVVGPQAKGSKFVFGPLIDPDDLCLDYDTSIIPPTKAVLQPPQERLATFRLGVKSTVEPVIAPVPTVLLGVHTCDLQAIRLLDQVFGQDYADAQYLAQREQTLVIGLECLKPCDEHSFCKDMGTLTADDGYDLHLTDIGEAYVVNVGTEEGEAFLAKYGQVQAASDDERARLDEVIGAKWANFQHRLDFEAGQLPSLLTGAHEHPVWAELGERCFACGSCTNVCPTCYCFNVTDEVNMHLTEGERVREWDSCQLDEFARVAGGESFREARAARQRHRLMRKGKYIYEKTGALGCVGCGRCIRTCLVHINIVEGFNTLHASAAGGAQ